MARPAYLTQHSIQHATVIGAGFIGLEMAENLSHAGAEVSVVDRTPQVMPPIDFSMAALVHQHLIQKGVTLFLEQTVASFAPQGSRIAVTFQSGERVETDLVILSVGVHMGVKREEMLDEVTVGGVATYMERAEQAHINLFI